jgi:hypothetical protein
MTTLMDEETAGLAACVSRFDALFVTVGCTAWFRISVRGAAIAFRDRGSSSRTSGRLAQPEERCAHQRDGSAPAPCLLKWLGRHNSFGVAGKYLTFGDLFEGHPLSGVL